MENKNENGVRIASNEEILLDSDKELSVYNDAAEDKRKNDAKKTQSIPITSQSKESDNRSTSDIFEGWEILDGNTLEWVPLTRDTPNPLLEEETTGELYQNSLSEEIEHLRVDEKKQYPD